MRFVSKTHHIFWIKFATINIEMTLTLMKDERISEMLLPFGMACQCRTISPQDDLNW